VLIPREKYEALERRVRVLEWLVRNRAKLTRRAPLVLQRLLRVTLTAPREDDANNLGYVVAELGVDASVHVDTLEQTVTFTIPSFLEHERQAVATLASITVSVEEGQLTAEANADLVEWAMLVRHVAAGGLLPGEATSVNLLEG